MAGEALSEMLLVQADACERFGAPFTAGLARHARADFDAGGVVRPLFAPWLEASRRTIVNDAAPLRLLGALHDLALSGEAPALAACYPHDGREGDAAGAWVQAQRLIPELADRIVRFMGHEPQTNEVGRSACLLGGFLTVACETGLPLSVVELGASAGLNQLSDRFQYDLGRGREWGERDAAVRLAPAWTGRAPPLNASVTVADRAACDRRPVDLADPIQRRRLQAYVWPDMPGRLARLQAAIDAAVGAGIRVETADAVDFARRMAGPRTGSATVLFHSIFWQYMPAQSQADLQTVIAGHGRAATREAPFAWLRMEPAPKAMAMIEVRLTIWPIGEERLLAEVHPHGNRVAWRA